ncbi:MAG: extradiol ring-cleavage dioxygenase [Thaumarchaeota archaeon]|nr:extradiol ring-cleavage dioxygenase [Nitrososphaerota archaeon]
MPVVYACIAPHGGETIPSLAGESLRLFAPTREGMRTLARGMTASAPDTLVIATPHNLRLQKHIGVVISENTSGRLAEGKAEVKLRAKCDLELGRALIDQAEAMGLPVAGANYGGLEGPSSDLAMDWGTLVPLWFFLKGRRRKSRVLIVTPSRGIPLKQNFDFGRAVAEVAAETTKRIAFVASSDQAHAHREDGPYGFSPRAEEYDRKVVEAVRRNRLDSILDFDPSLIEAAKPDSFWQMAMLAGVLSMVPMDGRVVSYQVPTYYGMLCARFSRRPSPGDRAPSA